MEPRFCLGAPIVRVGGGVVEGVGKRAIIRVAVIWVTNRIATLRLI